MAKQFKFVSKYSGEVTGYLIKNRYADNNNLYIGVMGRDASNNYFEPWCDLSVNLIPLKNGEFAFDANNNSTNNIIEVLQEAGVVEALGIELPSGYCKYPVYKVTSKFHAWCRD